MTDSLFEHLILAAGPARGGTTLLAKLLNAHPAIIAAIDNSAFENWAIYFYDWQIGLVRMLRDGPLTSQQARQHLAAYLIKEGELWGAAASDSVARYPQVPPPPWPELVGELPYYKPPAPPPPTPSQRVKRAIHRQLRRGWHSLQATLDPIRGTGEPNTPPAPPPAPRPLVRHRVPLSVFEQGARLCLKSPEITFVLPEMAALFPSARFVLVYRSVSEIAESMLRKAEEWRAYAWRWARDRDAQGNAILPPGVPDAWYDVWQGATDFQRCAIYATSYLRAMVEDAPKLTPGRVLVYDHSELRRDPHRVLDLIARCLQVDPAGFAPAASMIRDHVPALRPDLRAEYDALAREFDIAHWETAAADLAQRTRKDVGAT
jgi:hypothetical protein